MTFTVLMIVILAVAFNLLALSVITVLFWDEMQHHPFESDWWFLFYSLLPFSSILFLIIVYWRYIRDRPLHPLSVLLRRSGKRDAFPPAPDLERSDGEEPVVQSCCTALVLYDPSGSTAPVGERSRRPSPVVEGVGKAR